MAYLRDVVATFGPDEVAELAAIEKITVHDVKAVEYFLKSRLAAAPEGSALREVGELVHFACTSEDINNLSYALMVRGAVQDVWAPAATALVDQVAELARSLKDQPMLALTHGQPATPTTLGKELAVLAHRLRRQLTRIGGDEYLGKLNGATGTYGAHVVAVPGADWPAGQQGVRRAPGPDLEPADHADRVARLAGRALRGRRAVQPGAAQPGHRRVDLHLARRLHPDPGGGRDGLARRCRTRSTRSGSRTPRPTSSCRSALLDTLASTLVTSRLQRDLTDSTTQRNIGPAFGHSLLAIDNVARGLRALSVDEALLARELDENWEVLGEPVQSAMRAASVAGVTGMENPYERLKELTRGRRLTAADMREFIGGLGLPDDVAARLADLTPASYTGLADTLVGYLDA